MLGCAALLASAGLLVQSSRAWAYTGTGWDGTDPQSTGCGVHAITEYSFDEVSGWHVELRHSPDCPTAWTRVTCQHDFCWSHQFDVDRSGNGCSGYRDNVIVTWSPSSPRGTVNYTYQIYDGPCDVARAYDEITNEASGWY